MLVSNNLEHAYALATEIGIFFNPVCDHCISNEKDGRLLGGVIFQGFTGASIQIHVAGFDPRWIDRDMLWMAFVYPFEQLKVKKLIGQIPSDNRKALDFNRKLGFIEETRVAGVYRTGDMVVMTMTREQCRWLNRGSRGKKV